MAVTFINLFIDITYIVSTDDRGKEILVSFDVSRTNFTIFLTLCK